MSEWKTYKLGEVAVIKNGKSRPNEKGNIPVYGGNGILDYTNKHNTDNETIIIGRVGAYCGSVFFENKPLWISDNAMFTNSKENTSLKFLYYLLKEKNLNKYAQGSSHPLLTQGFLNNLEISIPNLATQTQIAQILTSLDDKIELNLQINQTLEAMAQALFKEWFVNFNFPSSESGFTELNDLQDLNNKSSKSKNPENQGSDNLPKGWRMGKLGEILQPKRGRNITKAEAIEGVFPVVAGGLEPSCYHNESNTKEPVITISSSGANAGFVRLYQMPVWSADSCFIDSSIFPFVHYCYIFLKSNQKNIYDSQESSAQPHIYPRHIMDLNICIGNDSVVQQFEEIVIPLFEKIKYNSLQIQTLTQTRDTLLPKLMSGKIEVKK